MDDIPNTMNAQRKALWRAIISMVIGMPVFFALTMFLPAGNWTWPRGWLFVGVFAAAMPLASAYLWRANPEIFVARTTRHRGTKSWDKVLLVFLITTMAAIFPVAALDGGRNQWSRVPDWLCAIGYVMLAAGFYLAIWAEAVNKFFEPTVRIQSDRGQVVVDDGPYRFVRHPGYVSAFFILFGIPLCLGSLCTRWEDQMLQAELAGYLQYTKRVRFRLVPGLW